MNIETFLKTFRLARIEIGIVKMSYIDSDNKFIIYRLNRIVGESEIFGLAFEIFKNEVESINEKRVG